MGGAIAEAKGEEAAPAWEKTLEQEDEVVRETVAARVRAEEGAPPRWVDVTTATRFLVSADRLTFHEVRPSVLFQEHPHSTRIESTTLHTNREHHTRVGNCKPPNCKPPKL